MIFNKQVLLLQNEVNRRDLIKCVYYDFIRHKRETLPSLRNMKQLDQIELQ